MKVAHKGPLPPMPARKKYPSKLAVFDIDDTFIYYDHNNPDAPKNFQPITETLNKLKKAADDPDTATVVITNSPHSHIDKVFKKLGLGAKTFFHRRDPDQNMLPSGRMELADARHLQQPTLIDCAFGISNQTCVEAATFGKKFSDYPPARYERKPQLHQLRDALKHLENLDVIQRNHIRKATVWGDLSHTDGVLAENLLQNMPALFGRNIQVKYRAVDPYRPGGVRDVARSAANYPTKTPLPAFGEQAIGRPVRPDNSAAGAA